MKRKMLCFLLTVAMVFTLGLPGSGFYVQAASPEWSQAGLSPNNNQVECLFEFNDQLYKGTTGNGVIAWNGAAWTQAGTAWPDGGGVMCLADCAGTLYAGTVGSGVLALENGAWTQVGASSWPDAWGSNATAYCLVEFNGTLYAGVSTGVWKIDNGIWTQVDAASWPTAYGYGAAGMNFVFSGGALYVQTSSKGVWKLDSGVWIQEGTSWPTASGSPDQANCLLADDSGKIYAGTTKNGVWTLNGAAEWTSVGAITAPPSFGNGVLCLADVAGTLYAGTLSDVWSWDGTSWTKAVDLPFSSSYHLLSADGILYYGGSDYVYALSGSSWQQVGSYDGLPKDSGGKNCLPLADVGGTLYAGTVDGVYELNNEKWEQIDASSWPKFNGSADRACSLLVDGGTVYAGTARNGVYAIGNDTKWFPVGAGWPSDVGTQYGAWSLAVHNGTLYAGTYDWDTSYNGSAGVWSLVGGTWTHVGTVNNEPGSWVTGLVSTAGKLYASEVYDGVWVLDENSGKWTILNTGFLDNNYNGIYYYFYSLVSLGGTLHVGGYNNKWSELLWTLDEDTWTKKSSSQPDGTNTINSLKEIDGTLYAGTNQGVFTVDSGGGLTRVGSCEQSIYSIASVGGILYVGTDNGVIAYGSGSDSGDDSGDHYSGGSTPNETSEIKTTVSGNTATVNIPKAALEQATDGKDGLKLSTPVASISFDADALAGINKEASGDVKITTAKVDASTLTDDTKELVGDHPVFNFSVTSGNNTISQFDGNVTVAVPYTPKAGEDTDAIVIYYINAEGKPEAVGNCKYDPATKTVSFTTNHFSKYAVGYNMVSFSDVKAAAWYENAVEFAAARGIVTGTGNGNFSPDGKLTRGQLLVMLMRAYGIEPDSNLSGNFSDAGNTYYTGYLAAAKRLGITEGLGNNLYAPEKQITRQEMFTLLYNTLKVIGQLPEGNGEASGVMTGYSDLDSVASWAKDASGALADAGIISGSNGKLSPKNTTTRAEMAQVLYNLLSK